MKADNLEVARGIAERIRHTLSAGLVRVFGEDCVLSEREMLQLADAALYEAKAGGRNRTAINAPLEELSAAV